MKMELLVLVVLREAFGAAIGGGAIDRPLPNDKSYF